MNRGLLAFTSLALGVVIGAAGVSPVLVIIGVALVCSVVYVLIQADTVKDWLVPPEAIHLGAYDPFYDVGEELLTDDLDSRAGLPDRRVTSHPPIRPKARPRTMHDQRNFGSR